MKAIRKSGVWGIMEDLNNTVEDSGLYWLGNVLPLKAHILLAVLWLLWIKRHSEKWIQSEKKNPEEQTSASGWDGLTSSLKTADGSEESPGHRVGEQEARWNLADNLC